MRQSDPSWPRRGNGNPGAANAATYRNSSEAKHNSSHSGLNIKVCHRYSTIANVRDGVT